MDIEQSQKGVFFKAKVDEMGMCLSTLKQLGKYTISGGFAALINFGSRIIYEITFSFNASLVLAYFTGLLVNYSLSRRYVFAESREANVTKQCITFIAIASAGLLITYVATLASFTLLSNMTQLDAALTKAIAHVFGIGCGFLGNFFGHKTITFKLPRE